MRKILTWIAYDGLLHILVCIAVSLSVLYLTDILWLSLLSGVIVSLIKEVIDVRIQKDNTLSQAWHDIVCDAIGLAFTTFLYITQL